MQEISGAKILIRGKGSQKEGAPPTGHPDDEVSGVFIYFFVQFILHDTFILPIF